MYKQGLALDNLQWLIDIKSNQTKSYTWCLQEVSRLVLYMHLKLV